MNKIFIAGHLGADPETRFTANGQKVTTFRMATNSRRGGKDVTLWWRVTVWGDRMDKLISYLKKGSGVMVWGALYAEIYTDREGRPQISLEVTAESIEFSPFGRGGDREGGGSGGGQQQQQQGQASQDHSFGEQTFGAPAGASHGQAQQAFKGHDDEQIPF